MKRALALLILAASLLVSGCISRPSGGDDPRSLITRALDAALPADFTGSAKVEHKNPWIELTIDAQGLRRTDTGWTWTGLQYRRDGRFSHGWITLTPEPDH
jgi:hypothetical protein